MAKYEQKTTETAQSVIEFIEAVDSPKKEQMPLNCYKFLKKLQVTSQKCGDRALLALALIIINIQLVTKDMPHLSAFLQEKQKLVFISQQDLPNGIHSYNGLENIHQVKPVSILIR